MATQNRKWLPVVLAVFVVIAGAGVGGFFGELAHVGYITYRYFANWETAVETLGDGSLHYFHEKVAPRLRPEQFLWPYLGLVLGAAGGAGGAVLWFLRMRELSVGSSGGRIMWTGLKMGLLAGIFATLLVHVGLGIAAGTLDTGLLGSGIICALFAGPATGLVCGLLTWGVAVRMRRKAQAESAATPTDGAANDAAEGT